jgi:ABC-2 type transport system ATP-binding protein
VFDRPAVTLDRHDRSRIGYLPQTSALYPELTLRHNLNLAASLYGLPWRPWFAVGRRGRAARRAVEDALAFVDLTDHARTRLGDAAGGEQRRIGLAAAVVHDPDLLVLDEPTAGVDPQSRASLLDRIGHLRDEGVAVLYTSHYMEEVERLCDRVGIIDHGRVIAEGRPSQLVRDHAQARDLEELVLELTGRQLRD